MLEWKDGTTYFARVVSYKRKMFMQSTAGATFTTLHFSCTLQMGLKSYSV